MPLSTCIADAGEALLRKDKRAIEAVARRNRKKIKDPDQAAVKAIDQVLAPLEVELAQAEKEYEAARAADARNFGKEDERAAPVAREPQDLLGEAPSKPQQEAAKVKAEKTEKARKQQQTAPDAGDFSLTGSDRAADEGVAKGQNELFEPDKPYETDLFGAPLPRQQALPDAGGGPADARPDRSRVRRDAQPAAPVQRQLGEDGKPADAAQDAPGEFYVDTYVSTPVQRALGARTIKNPGDLAAATRYLYDSAVERFDAIVTDENGKPLAVVGGFKGALSQTSVYPSTIVGEAVRVPGATHIWFSHNHPSGNPQLSEADKHLNATLHDVFRGSGIEPMGVIAVGSEKFGYHSVEHEHFPRESGLTHPIPASSGKIEVPVYERNQRDDRVAKRAIGSPTEAKQIAREFYTKAKGPGMLLLDAQNQVAGWVPIDGLLTGRLRGTGGLRALYKAASRGNIAAVIFAHGGELDARSSAIGGQDPVMNIGAALRPIDVRVLDAINVSKPGAPGGMESRAEKGLDHVGHTAYARGAWRSELEDAIAGSTMNAAPAQSWREFLSGLSKKGVKPDEIEWSGVREWLQLQQGKVTKEQVLAFLADNGVKVQEVLKGGESAIAQLDRLNVEATALGWEFDRNTFEGGDEYTGRRVIMIERGTGTEFAYDPQARMLVDEDGAADTIQEGPILGIAQAIYDLAEGERESEANADGTRYGNYTLPGGENYRELLLTLPMAGQFGKRTGGQADMPGNPFSGVEFADNEVGVFQSSHWSEDNILAHIRMNDRTDADGKKVLFIEELQSDWAQQGRKKGFAPTATARAEADALTRKADAAGGIRNLSEAEQARGRELGEILTRSGVPNAPFVEKTDAWVTLALKRIVKYAADNGYDRVAFVNGQQSAERYDLSKQVKELQYDEKTRNLVGLTNGNRPFTKTVTPEELPDVVGKEVAKRLLEAPPGAGFQHRLSGLDLKVGGEGMKAFYDKIVPAAVNKLLPKLGGERMGAVPIKQKIEDYERTARWVGPERSIDDVRRMLKLADKSGASIHDNPLTGARETFAINRVVVAGDLRHMLKDMESGKSFAEALVHPDVSGTAAELFGGKIERFDAGHDILQQPGFDVTPAMREAATHGLPLFARPAPAQAMPNSVTVQQARDRIREMRGASVEAVQGVVEDFTKGWKNAPPVHVVATYRDLPIQSPPDARGLHYRGEVWIVAAAHRAGGNLRQKVASTLAHEALAHYGLRQVLGADFERLLTKPLHLALASGNKQMAELRTWVRDHYKDAEGTYSLSARDEVEEIAARAVELAIDKDGKFRPGYSWLKAVWARVAQFLRGLGLNVEFTQAELHGMLVRSMHGLERGRRFAGGAEVAVPAFSQQDTESDAEDSKAVEGAAFIGYLSPDGKFESYSQAEAEKADYHHSFLVKDLDAYDAEGSLTFVRMNNRPVVSIKGTPAMDPYAKASQPMVADLARRIIDAGGHPDMPIEVENMGFKKAEAPYQGKRIGTLAQWAAKAGQFARGGESTNFARGGQEDFFAPQEWAAPDNTTTDKVIYELQDGRVDLKRVQQAIEAAGQRIEEKFDARLAETLYPGRVARRTELFLSREVKPLLKAIARVGATLDELGDYLMARHAPDRNAQIARVNPDLPDGGAGRNSRGELMTTEAAEAFIESIPPERRALLEELAQAVDRITAGTRSLLVAEGLEKQETIDRWVEAQGEHYVPLFKDEVDGGGAAHPIGTGFNVRGSSSKRATGSTRQARDVLAHVLMQREAAITRAEKNRVGLALYGLALAHPNREFWTTIRPGMTNEAIGHELEAMGVDPDVAVAGMQRVPTITDVDKHTGQVVHRPNPIYKSMLGAITVRLNGEDRVLLLNAKNERAARMAADLKNLDGMTRLDLAGNIVGKSTRWLAAVNTQYNPAFGLVNVTRDTWGGLVNLGSTKIRGRGLKVLADVPKAMVGIGWGLFKEHHTRLDPSGLEWSKLWQQFQQDGGRTGYREMFKRADERARKIEQELRSAGPANSWLVVKRGGRWMLNLLDGFNETLENAVRLSAYKEALNKGLSRTEAARIGRELTVDFNRKGRTGRELNPLYAFFNANVQGGARTIETLKGPTGRAVIVGGLSLGVLQAMMLLAADYDDDEIPDFVKTRSLIIPLPKNEKGEKRFIQIPYPIGLHVLPNTGRVLTELGLSGGKDLGKKLTNAIGEIVAAFNPLGSGNFSEAPGHAFLTTIAPTVVDPIVDLVANRNFAGNPIERQSMRGELDNRPGVARVRERTERELTGQAYIAISRAINAATGGTPYERGLLSPTPERARYIAQTVGGGVLREIEKAVNSSFAAMNGEDVSLSGVPIVGRFKGEVDSDRVTERRYFDRSRELDKLHSSINAAKSAGDADALEHLVERPGVAMIQAHDRVQRHLAELNRLAASVVTDREQLRLIDEARVEEMRGFNEAFEALEAAQGPTPGQRLKAQLRGEAR